MSMWEVEFCELVRSYKSVQIMLDVGFQEAMLMHEIIDGAQVNCEAELCRTILRNEERRTCPHGRRVEVNRVTHEELLEKLLREFS